MLEQVLSNPLEASRQKADIWMMLCALADLKRSCVHIWFGSNLYWSSKEQLQYY